LHDCSRPAREQIAEVRRSEGKHRIQKSIHFAGWMRVLLQDWKSVRCLKKVQIFYYLSKRNSKKKKED
jgi:hypothetical protein